MGINIILGSSLYDPQNSIATNRGAVPVSNKSANIQKSDTAAISSHEILSLHQLFQTAVPEKTDQPENNATILGLTCDLREALKGFRLSDITVRAFINKVLSWKDNCGTPIMEGCKETLDIARKDYETGKISMPELAYIETKILTELGMKIKSEFSQNDQIFELPEVLRSRKAQCVSYTQMVYVVASSMGLPVQGVNVSNMSKTLFPAEGHVVGLVGITDKLSVFVDLTQDPARIVSQPFSLAARYEKAGNYLALNSEHEDEDIDRATRYRKIQLLDLNGLIAYTYLNRGVIAHKSGRYQQAIANFDTAISMDPGFAEAFCYRGSSYYYTDSGKYERAIANYDTAIAINPEFVDALNGRGSALIKSGQTEMGENDLQKAKKLLNKE